MLFWKGGSLLYKNNVTSQPTMQWYKNRLLVFRISFWISYGYTNKADIFRRNWVLWNLNTKYYQIFHDIETTNTGIWIRNIVTVLKKNKFNIWNSVINFQGTMTSKQQIRKLENNYNCVKKIRFGNNSSCILQKCYRSVHDVRSCSSRLPLSFVFHTLPAILSIWTRSMHSGPLAELATSGRATCSDSSGSGFRMVVHRNLWRATSSSKRQRSGKMIFCSSSSLKSKRSTLVIYL